MNNISYRSINFTQVSQNRELIQKFLKWKIKSRNYSIVRLGLLQVFSNQQLTTCLLYLSYILIRQISILRLSRLTSKLDCSVLPKDSFSPACKMHDRITDTEFDTLTQQIAWMEIFKSTIHLSNILKLNCYCIIWLLTRNHVENAYCLRPSTLLTRGL